MVRSMDYRQLGRSGLRVSALTLGTMTFGGRGAMADVGNTDVAGARGYQRFVSQQIHYTLQAREAEYELIPLALDQGVDVLVWSPLAGGLLSGKFRRGEEGPAGSRALTDWDEPPVRDRDALYDII